MTDKELLELAARAAEIKIIRNRLDDPLCNDMLISNSVRNPHHDLGAWNPLTDDGDALRLAVTLRLTIDPTEQTVWIRRDNGELIQDYWGGDYNSCYRNTIVRAAAELGKGMS